MSDPASTVGIGRSSLFDKTALETGASRSIGRATALVLGGAAARRCSCTTAAAKTKRPPSSTRSAAPVEEPRSSASTSARRMERTTWRSARSIIGGRFDVLVANAGVSKAASIEETTVEHFNHLFAINVRAPFLLVQQLLPALCKGSSVVLVQKSTNELGASQRRGRSRAGL